MPKRYLSIPQQKHAHLFQVLLCGLWFWIGCGSDTPQQSVDANAFVAKLDNQILTRGELRRMMSSLPKGSDSLEATRQIIEQWTTRALMAKEAEAQNLQSNPIVKTQIEESRQSVLIAALMDTWNKNLPKEPTPTEIATYFAEHKAQLLLREPYVRVRYMRTSNQEKANAAHQALQIADSTGSEQEWEKIAKQYAEDAKSALELAENFIPESRLLDSTEPVWKTLGGMKNGEISDVISLSNKFHVIQLVERLPIGTAPKIAWVQQDIREILRLNAQQKAYLDRTQELKNKALSNGSLKIVGK